MGITNELIDYLESRDIGLYGFADLAPVPAVERLNFPYGIVFGIPYSREGMLQNKEDKLRICYEEYYAYNRKMGDVGEGLADLLVQKGYKADNRKQSATLPDADLHTILPYKTVATLAGLGWIGKCALLVSEEYGSAFRMSVVLTNAPLDCGEPVAAARCPDSCMVCTEVCPGHAPSGKRWRPGLERKDFFDAHACNTAARARAKELVGVEESICGLCMANCPFTRRAFGY